MEAYNRRVVTLAVLCNASLFYFIFHLGWSSESESSSFYAMTVYFLSKGAHSFLSRNLDRLACINVTVNWQQTAAGFSTLRGFAITALLGLVWPVAYGSWLPLKGLKVMDILLDEKCVSVLDKCCILKNQNDIGYTFSLKMKYRSSQLLKTSQHGPQRVCESWAQRHTERSHADYIFLNH